MTAYYNEFDKKTAAWLRELVKRNLIAPGDVDDRPIQEVKPDDIRHYRQVHFFAGIGGWSYALRLAGWPDDRPVWTGSCPCQPFSTAGKQKGAADERHLWPEMFRLVRECRPAIAFGEQVEGAVRHGWLDGVFGDLEGAGYACGAAVLGAHSVGAPHIRQRLYWLADANGWDASAERQQRSGEQRLLKASGVAGGLGHADERGRQQGDAISTSGATTAGIAGPWSDYTILTLRDGSRRRAPVEPAFQPLATRLPARVVRLRGYGNAINPQDGAAFVMAYLESTQGA